MAQSNIISETIDATYPVAGVDNDTQGFRDNFQIIKDGLATAKTEITSLNEQTVKLTDSTNGVVENDFNESSILDASLDNVTFKLKAFESWNENTTVNVDIGRGGYQVYGLGADITDSITFSLQNWPVRNTNNGVARMTLQLTGNGNDTTVKFIAANGGQIKFTSAWPIPDGLDSAQYTDDSALITLTSQTRPSIIEFWSYDSGTTVYADFKGIYNNSGNSSA